MKRQFSTLISVLGLLLVAACANAQTLKVTANVPFDFVVDKATLPAGNYSIDAIDTAGNSKALAIRGENAKKNMLVLSNSAISREPSENSKLVFHRYGDKYFLAQIWVAGERSGRELHISRREAEVAKNTQASENVIVLAALR